MSSKERVTQEFFYVPMVPIAVEAEKETTLLAHITL